MDWMSKYEEQHSAKLGTDKEAKNEAKRRSEALELNAERLKSRLLPGITRTIDELNRRAGITLYVRSKSTGFRIQESDHKWTMCRYFQLGLTNDAARVYAVAGFGKDPDECPKEWPHSLAQFEGEHARLLVGHVEADSFSDQHVQQLFQWLVAAIKGEASKFTNPSFMHEPTEATTSSPQKASNCFIAAAVYGDENAPELELLRNFRDLYLLKRFVGRLFVSLYVTFSPLLANVIKKHESLRKLVQMVILGPILRRIERTILPVVDAQE
jgi:hypothetical protein